jgi:hypothetical protein
MYFEILFHQNTDMGRIMGMVTPMGNADHPP